MGIIEGIALAITVLTAVVKIVDMIVDKFFPETDAVNVVDFADALLDTAGKVVEVVKDTVDTIGEDTGEGDSTIDGAAAPSA